MSECHERAEGATIVRGRHGTSKGRGTSLGEVHDIALKVAETGAIKPSFATSGGTSAWRSIYFPLASKYGKYSREGRVKRMTFRAAAHFDQIRRGGITVALRKIARLIKLRKIALLIKRSLWSTFWIIVYPLILLLRPFVLIRFGPFDVLRIGHFVQDLAYYLAERDLGKCPPRSVDVFYFRGKISNFYFAKFCRRYVRVLAGARYATELYRFLPGGEPHLLRIETSTKYGYRDQEGVMARTPRCVLSPKEMDRGWDMLASRWQIPQGAPIVCVQVRSANYLDRIYIYDLKSKQAEYRARHAHRNPDIRSFIPAMQELADRGYYCFRMGAVPDVPLGTHNYRIIDYANAGRTEFLDVFLAANCKFFISTSSGIDALAILFRNPVVYCNQMVLEPIHMWMPNISIFKRHREKLTGRLLTFQKIIDPKFVTYDAREYEKRGIELIDNTAEEIRAAVLEMANRLDEKYVNEPGGRERQVLFWKLVQSSAPIVKMGYQEYQERCVGRIGADFLRENEPWLLHE